MTAATLASEISEDDRNLMTPAFFAHGDIHGLWKRHRNEAPVRWTKTPYGRGYWSLTSYDRVRDIYLNPTVFSSQRNGATLPLDALMADPEKSPSIRLAMKGAILPTNDPPRHGVMRRALQHHFLAASIQAMEPFIERLANNLIGEMLQKGECDFVNDIAARLPSTIIFEIMQAPREDWEFLFQMANGASAPADPDYGQGASVLESRTKALMAICNYVLDLAKKRRSNPGDDLISLLATATVNGEPLTDEEIGYNGFMFVTAGQETTRNSLAAGILELIKNPAQMRLLREDATTLDTAPDEFVRWASPVAHVLRTATKDMNFGGQLVREGDWLVAWIASANRDEKAFQNADTFDIARKPNPHLGFGAADHFCLGAVVARTQLKRILKAFVEHVGSIELTGAVERVESHQFPGFKKMPVRVTAKARP